MKFLITGGAGFIGSQFVRTAQAAGHDCTVLDKFTYAGSSANFPDRFSQWRTGDIANPMQAHYALKVTEPDAVFNFAAESHVDRSIRDADSFVHSNVRGTYVLLRETLNYWRSRGEPKEFRYVQISTDEVFGDLGPLDPPFTESSPRRPNSPYAASKCSADHFVSAFVHTFGLPCLTTYCSNNYGPRQYPEKLIPRAVCSFLAGDPFVLHGAGSNVRDWISVEDHCFGILATYLRGQIGESYCFGGASERDNHSVVRAIRDYLGEGEITFGPDRPGNDRRYAINFSKATRELNWSPQATFEEEITKTIDWYCENRDWVAHMMSRS